MQTIRVLFAIVCAGAVAHAQERPTLSPAVKQFVTVDAPVVALTHVKLVDGTGKPARDNQTVIIRGARIAWVGDAAKANVPPNARTVELNGHTLTPGFVGMHQHTYFRTDARLSQMSMTGPRLYLVGGVTTIRTAGSMFPYNELNMKRAVEKGEIPGPRMHITGPYLNGEGNSEGDNRQLLTEAEARRVVAYWATEGATWLKFSGSITRSVMKAAIDEAHKHGMKATGHLCSVTFREAAALGIDNLEHGLITNSDYIPDKKPDVCPRENMRKQIEVDVDGPAVKQTFRDLLAHHVALTSTLSVYELFVPSRAKLMPRALEVLAPAVREEVQASYASLKENSAFTVAPLLFDKMMKYERAWVAAGGLLVAGVDPWGNGSLPGFGDQRNYEILVEAGFTPEQAIQIMTANGAKLLGQSDQYGTVAAGKRADLAIFKGDPTKTSTDIENVVLVFRDGVGYDSAKLLASVKGQVGLH